jgi:thiamine pyrophosphate-dependent acetolactate synthase large subunit-like protein
MGRMTMKSEDAVQTIIANRGDAVLVPTMTAIKWVDKYGSEGLNISCVPLMGGASALGLGIALAQPNRPVIVLDGDGSLLMQLPSLVTIASSGATNLVHIVFNNGVWFENLANIPVPGAQAVDFVATAKAVGFKHAMRVSDKADLANALAMLIAKGEPGLLELTIEPEKAGVWMKGKPQPDLADFHFNRLGIELHRLRDALLQKGAA